MRRLAGAAGSDERELVGAPAGVPDSFEEHVKIMFDLQALAMQGNLDPALLLAPWPVVESAVCRVVTEGRAATGHVFNLGHGVLPDTDPDVLTRVVALVHSLTAR